MYVETPGVAPTAAPATVEPYTRDLVEVLAVRMTANPALHVVVCTPAEPDYPFGFNPFSDDERAKRRTALLGLPTANVADAVGNRVVAFHTVGFPGRPSRLESTTVIVDDVAALVGSSTMRRRGLTFDGSTDRQIKPRLAGFASSKGLAISGPLTRRVIGKTPMALSAAAIIWDRLRTRGRMRP